MPPQPLRQVCRARLILDKARALPRALLLIPLLLCLGTLPARAGTWTFTCTGSGSLTYVPFGPTPCRPIYWTLPGPQSGRFDLGSTFGGDAYSDYYGSTSAKATITLQVAATWSPAAGQTAATDPPPPSVWLCESGRTEWSIETYLNPSAGKCSDGLGAEDAETNTSGIADSSKAAVTSPPAYWTNASVVNGVATLPQRTLSAAVNIVPAGHGNYFSVHIDNYSVTIHPQPYGWYDAGWSANGTDPDTTPGPHSANGSLGFRYKWRSTDGVLADLNGISIYEYVDYSGNPGRFTNYPSGPNYYYPTNPPIGDVAIQGGGTIGFHVQNPEISTAPSTSGFTYDIHSAWPTKAPLSKFTCVAPQQYKFDDPATAQVGIVLYAPGSITDAVQLNPNQFYVGKGTGSAITPL
jgi:hypothetical protein